MEMASFFIFMWTGGLVNLSKAGTLVDAIYGSLNILYYECSMIDCIGAKASLPESIEGVNI